MKFNRNKQCSFTCNNTYINPHLVSLIKLLQEELIPQYCIDNNLIQSEHSFTYDISLDTENTDLHLCELYEIKVDESSKEEKLHLGISILFDLRDIEKDWKYN